MAFEALANSLNRRLHRRRYRAMLKRWSDDGGDRTLRFDYDLDEHSLVLDLGGYEGQWASDLYARYRCRIFVFEPVRSFADQISERFRKNSDIAVLPFGLGGASRTQTIYVRGASSSTYRKRSNAQQIEIVDTAKWFSDNDIRSVQLMKINVEGGEYELLERLIETKLIQSIDNVQVQFHNFTTDATERMESIQAALLETHSPTYQYRFIWENWRRNGDSGK